jgi:hypothetical protein
LGVRQSKPQMQVGGKLSHATITQIFYLPKMKNSLISMIKLIYEGFKMEFNKNGCKVNDV